ncbi:hypothetical protein HGO38_19870 [Rhizobium sp. CG5]|uniref:hypothetical protein n=1 Tax=Rhizobium sp. CG5 TaxID=2726076 RepID=UPI0020348847|nr:hypothetical protein [Rhizobium sp. CG5]MCM2475736.1 hypothetical protein [Rhizobium sp. CG5]
MDSGDPKSTQWPTDVVGHGACGERAANAVISLYVLAIAALVTAFRFPPILDFPNHYARLWLIAGGIETEPFPGVYALEWDRTATNVGIDLLTRLIGPTIGVDLLAHVFLFLAIVLPPLGAIVLHRRLFGGSHVWQIALLFTSWCATMIGGFINFQIGLGLALLFAAADLSLKRHHPAITFVWRMAVGLILTLNHVFSVGFFIVLICALEIPADLRELLKPGRLAGVVRRVLLAATAAALAPLSIFLSTDNLPADYQGRVPTVWTDNLGLLISNLLSGISTYLPVVDLLFLLPIAAVLVFALVTGRFRLHGGLCLGACGLVLISIISPTHFMGTGWISWRFPIMAGLTLLAMICPFPQASRRQLIILVTALCLAVFGRTGWIGYNWWQGQRDVDDVLQAIELIPPGSAVLPLLHEVDPSARYAAPQRFYGPENPIIWHLPTLAVPMAHSFVPTVFAARGKQPLMVLPPWTEIAVQDGAVASIATLICPAMRREAQSFAPYLAHWHERFDYVLVVNADMPDRTTGEEQPQGLQLIRDGGFADLYKVDRSVPLDIDTVSSPSCPK